MQQIRKPKKARLHFVAGGVGAGKSTLGKLIVDYLSPPRHVVTIDSSRCIDNSVRRKTDAGRDLEPFLNGMKKGALMPAELAFQSIMENVYWLEEAVDPTHIIIPGAYRAPEEGELWKSVRDIVSWNLFFIPTTDEEIAFGVYLRQREGGAREDDADPRVVQKRIREYKDKTEKAMEAAPNELYEEVPRSEPLLTRIKALVEHMKPEPKLRDAWLRELSIAYRPIRKAISQKNAEEVAAREDFRRAHAAAMSHRARPLVPLHEVANGQLALATA